MVGVVGCVDVERVVAGKQRPSGATRGLRRFLLCERGPDWARAARGCKTVRPWLGWLAVRGCVRLGCGRLTRRVLSR